MEKKIYTTPTLNAYGDVKAITLNGGQPNADLPQGPNGTAFSPK
ncbi:MAG: hypothetical protein NVS4B8_27880 [Herpetosiphon sp.]